MKKKKSSNRYIFFCHIEHIKKVLAKSKMCRSIFNQICTVCKRMSHIR